MDTHFGVNFADCFQSLSNLLDESQKAAERPPDVSRAAGSSSGPACVGPQGIFPDVKVAEPIGTSSFRNGGMDTRMSNGKKDCSIPMFRSLTR